MEMCVMTVAEGTEQHPLSLHTVRFRRPQKLYRLSKAICIYEYSE
jgi:hypothetical protein